ncbi:MAG: hypothetical protein LQ349_003549 [Xanthoria aureola]|nr:MAG: hypothetical protein LQ349_003549 [Xanthoria aureola]
MPWKSAKVIGLLVGFAVIGVMFATLQWFLGDKGTISPRVLRQRSVLMGCLFEFFLSMTLFIYSYYVPFYFQAAQSVSATTSGVRYIAFAVPEVVAIVVVGAIVTKIGYYVRLDLSEIDRVFSRLTLAPRFLSWFSAQWSLLWAVAVRPSLRAIAIPIGNAILVNGLLKQIPRHTQSVSAQDVIRAGSTNLRTLTSDMSTLLSLQTGYAEAVVATIYLALAAGCASFPFAVFMEWRSVKPGAGPHEKDKKDVETATTVKPVIKG